MSEEDRDPFYTYGDDLTQNVAEARQAIIDAFDSLILEMKQHIASDIQYADKSETIQHQNRTFEMIKKALKKSKINTKFEFDIDATLNVTRDYNSKRHGYHIKRLDELNRLRSIFDATEPENVPPDVVHETYTIMKVQVMRCATKIGYSYKLRINLEDMTQLLVIYANALIACGRLDETWDDWGVYPFSADL